MSRVRFEAEFTAPRLVAPIAGRLMARQFRRYHESLRCELEDTPSV